MLNFNYNVVRGVDIMNSLIDFLAAKEVIIVLAILGLIIVVYFILWFIDFMKKHDEKKKLQNNTMELNKLVLEVAKEEDKKVEEVKNTEVKEVKIEPIKEVSLPKEEVKTPLEVASIPVVTPLVKETPVTVEEVKKVEVTPQIEVAVVEPEVITPKEEIREEAIKYKDEVYTKTEAKQELERLTEELKKIEETKEDPNENIELTKYETEQEENAIISLEELMAKGKAITEQNEIREYQDDGNEPISIQELEARYNKEKEMEEIEVLEIDEVKEEKESPKVTVDDFLNGNTKIRLESSNRSSLAYNKEHAYKPTPIISPIYGIEEDKVTKNTSLELEDTATFEKLDEEIRKTNEFLSKLKELKQKLD